MNKQVVPVLLLGSGVALTAAGLLLTFAYGSGAPLACFILMAAGILDGVTGLAWTATRILWGSSGIERTATPEAMERQAEAARRLLMVTGILSIVFLGLLAAVAFQMPVILAWLRGGLVSG